MKSPPRSSRNGPLVALALATGVVAGPAAAQDAEADAVRDSIEAGECATALAQARQWVADAPQNPAAHRGLGDAERCLDHPRESVLAYRKAKALGMADPALDALVESQARTLAVLPVRVAGRNAKSPLEVRLELGPQRSVTLTADQPEIRFLDLPTKVPLVLRASGPGYAPVTLELPALAAGANAPVAVDVRYLGAATLELGAPQSGVEVTVESGGESRRVTAAEVTVSPGAATVRISGLYGATSVDVAPKDGERVRVDVAALVPGQLTLAELPAGSTITVTGAGKAPVERAEIPWSQGKLDERLGINVGAVVQVPGVPAGTYGWRVEHPLMGTAAGEVAVVGGEATVQAVERSAFPRADALGRAYADHQAGVKEARRVPAGTKRGLALAAGGGALLAGSAFLTVRALALQGSVAELDLQYEQALVSGASADAHDLYELRNQARTESRLCWAGAGVGAGVGVVGVGFSWGSFKQGKGQKRPVPEWNPQTLVLP